MERAKASFQAGATAYAAGEYLAAIQALETAYALTPVAAIGFSLAQAERREYFVSHRREYLDRAIALFRHYVQQVPSGGRRADALDALSQLEPLATASGNDRPSTDREGDPNRPTRLMITSDAPGARLSIDGGSPATSPLIREVAPGPHKITVQADGFFDDERVLTAVKGELIPEGVSLRERPSSLAISAPSSAELYVDGAFTSHGGARVTFELSSGIHRLTIAEKGYKPWVRELDLQRGESREVQVVLHPTGQRSAAHALFWSSAAAFGTGAVFGALALRSEHLAQDFLARMALGNVSGDDLSSYGTYKAERERYRIASAVSLAASAGLLITGLFLYELDRPNAEHLSRPKPPPVALRWQPIALPGGGGALVEGVF